MNTRLSKHSYLKSMVMLETMFQLVKVRDAVINKIIFYRLIDNLNKSKNLWRNSERRKTHI